MPPAFLPGAGRPQRKKIEEKCLKKAPQSLMARGITFSAKRKKNIGGGRERMVASKKTLNGKFPRMANRVEGAGRCSFGLYARSVQIMPSHSQPYFQFLVSPFPRSRNWRLGSDDDDDDKRGRMDLERRGRKGREKTLISAESSFLFRPPLENRTEGRGRILRV